MVACVVIAATVILLTFQPALASIVSLAGIPSSCQSSCKDLQTGIKNSKCHPTPQCHCTQLVANYLTTCFQCFVSIGSVEPSYVNDTLNNFALNCAQVGISNLDVSPPGSSSLSGFVNPSPTVTGPSATVPSTIGPSTGPSTTNLSATGPSTTSLSTTSLSATGPSTTSFSTTGLSATGSSAAGVNATGVNATSPSNTLSTVIPFTSFSAASKMSISTFSVIITIIFLLL